MAETGSQINVEYSSDANIVSFMDQKILEEKDVRNLEIALMEVVEQANGANLVLDFVNVKFMSSAVLGLLIKLSKKVYESKLRMALCGISPKIHEIFKITRLTKIFDIYKDVDSAIEGLSQEQE